MASHSKGRLAGAGGRVFVAMTAILASFVFAASALATEHHPTGIYAVFNQCPLSNPEIRVCVFAETTSGEFTVGSRSVPINKTIVLQGGYKENGGGEIEFFAAENGETLTKVALTVPGGLNNVVAPEALSEEQKKQFEKIINEGPTGVTATTELAKPASAIKLSILNLVFEEGVALQLPVKVKLTSNSNFLGSTCYVGSESNPVILNLTTGITSPPEPNKPIRGSAGTLEIREEGSYLKLSGGSLVDNAWAAPEAHGCGSMAPEKTVNEAVNRKFGLPSAAGHNTAILSGTLQSGEAAAVKASE